MATHLGRCHIFPGCRNWLAHAIQCPFLLLGRHVKSPPSEDIPIGFFNHLFWLTCHNSFRFIKLPVLFFFNRSLKIQEVPQEKLLFRRKWSSTKWVQFHWLGLLGLMGSDALHHKFCEGHSTKVIHFQCICAMEWPMQWIWPWPPRQDRIVISTDVT